MTTRLAALLALGLVISTTWSAEEEPAKPGVEILSARLEQGRVLVSFRLLHALSADTLERIDSGIPVRFRHRIEIRAKRGFPLLPSKVVARTVVETRVEYDSLTRRYHLLRSVDTLSREKELAAPPTVERRDTASPEIMEAWMTELNRIPVYDPAGPFPDGELRVKVEVSLGRRYVLWVFPTALGASQEGEVER